MDEAYVSIANLRHQFGSVRAIEQIDLVLAKGEFVAIVGPSGCGKTTLLRALAGLEVPTKGSITLDGKSIVGSPGQVGLLPQNDLLMPWRRAIDNATVSADISGGDTRAIRSKAMELFARFGLRGFEQAWPHQLSAGMRQRVAVLRTFLLEQSVLAFDEPFGLLDALTRQTMQLWLEEVWMQDPRTILLVTHDIDEALLLSDRVLVMSDRPGHLIEEIALGLERPRSVTMTTQHDFVDAKHRILRALGKDAKDTKDK